MNKILLIDGNSILNRAFYGIMGSKMLMTDDGTYTNAIYGFLSILFKELNEVNPTHIMVAFDLKAPTFRHDMYKEYKAGRHAMPEELKGQFPIIKEVLKAMNITILEKEGYEADDILGTIAKYSQKNENEVVILSGDRDTFQLVDKNIQVKIPRTKMGKTETDIYDIEKIKEEYGIEPIQFIQIKGLMGDSGDNIPGVPGVGEKTAFDLIKKYETVDNVYKKLEDNTDDIKGKLREKLTNNKELAYLSKELGAINCEVPIEKEFEEFKIIEYNNEKLLELFKILKFNKFMDKLNLKIEGNSDSESSNVEKFEIQEMDITQTDKISELIYNIKIFSYYLEKEKCEDEKLIINKKLKSISIYNEQENKVYYINITDINKFIEIFKKIFEDNNILKNSYKLKEDYIILKQLGINTNNLMFDIEIAAYVLNSNKGKYSIEDIGYEYLKLDFEEYVNQFGINQDEKEEQLNLFNTEIKEEKPKTTIDGKSCVYTYIISKLYYILLKKIEEVNQLELFNNIEMPLLEVLADMQYTGMHIDKEMLIAYGQELKNKIEELTKEIYNLTGEEFNINSTKQLGVVLFEKLQLTVVKKGKTGYSTDVDVLEKLIDEHPVIEKLLEYRQITKLNSTYVEGMIPYINGETNRIHSYFHQTVTSTGRISSTEPNLQNIPIKIELGKKLRKVFTVENDNILIDADYSQIELRVLAHISNDENMIEAFNNDEDIHSQVASKVFNVPLSEVTKELRSNAKAVNFGIVYGISDFGLAGNIGIGRKQAKEYITQYLEKYSGIKQFMEDIVNKAKETGYVDTLFNRRRYIPEINSSNHMVREFGKRVALNTPIQGTAADIIKIAMINVYKELNNRNLKSKLILQVHDELLIEVKQNELEEVKEILRNCMEQAIKMNVPLKVELEQGANWYDSK